MFCVRNNSSAARAPSSPGCHSSSLSICASGAAWGRASLCGQLSGEAMVSGTFHNPRLMPSTRQARQNGVKTLNGPPVDFDVTSHGSNNKLPLELSASSPLSFSLALMSVSRAMISASYWRFHITADAFTSAAKAGSTSSALPSRYISLLPRARKAWSSLASEASRHQTPIAPAWRPHLMSFM